MPDLIPVSGKLQKMQTLETCRDVHCHRRYGEHHRRALAIPHDTPASEDLLYAVWPLSLVRDVSLFRCVQQFF